MKRSFPLFASTDELASLSRCSPIKKLGFPLQLHICDHFGEAAGLFLSLSVWDAGLEEEPCSLSAENAGWR